MFFVVKLVLKQYLKLYSLAWPHQIGSIKSNDSAHIKYSRESFQNFLLLKRCQRWVSPSRWTKGPEIVDSPCSIYPEQCSQLFYRLYANWVMVPVSIGYWFIIVFLTNQAPPDYSCQIWRARGSSAGLRMPLFTHRGLNLSVKPWSSYYRWFCKINNSVIGANIGSVLGL